MKIGLLIYGSINTLSGGYYYDRMLVDYLRAHGDDVEIISLPWRNYASHLSDNFSVKLPKGLDVLIQDELNHPSLIGANLGRHEYPVISLVHHLRCSELRPAWQNSFYRLVEKKYLQTVDGFIFNSKTTEDVVNRLIVHHKPSMVAFPPTDRFGHALSEAEITTRAQTSPLRILFIGNVIGRKGLHVLLSAVKNLRSQVVVDVVGSLTYEPGYVGQIKDFINTNDLSSFVFLHGALDAEPLKDLLTRAHILVVPSSYEGFGIVYLEGMCFGLPAIGTRAGAAGEVIQHGETGYLITPGDSTTLAGLITDLASDRHLLTRLSLNAWIRYLAQPTWAETASQIRKFLQQVCA